MNSFTLTAVGQLARNPELVARGDTAYTRFCLVGTDYAGKDDEGAAREVVTSLWFVAFGALGEAVARHSRKGDQLIVEARVRANIWTDKQGDKQYDHSFVVQGFRFGAPGRMKREERDARRDDGHGLQRSEDRASSRDRSANGSAYDGLGARARFDVDARIGTRTGLASHAGAVARVEPGTDAMPVAVRGVNGRSGAQGTVSGKHSLRVNEAASVGRAPGVGGAHESPGAHKSRGADDSADAYESVSGDQSAGVEGSAGADCPDGADGSGDAAGDVGTDGSAGAAGDVDADGFAGAAGDAGAHGLIGAAGDVGADRSAGAAGDAGADGSIGPGADADADGSAGTDRTARTDGAPDSDESGGADASDDADEVPVGRDGRGRASHVATGAAKGVARDTVKGSSRRVSETRATTSRTREKSGGNRSGRRASASAA
jgi:single-strand DNA-binding protein